MISAYSIGISALNAGQRALDLVGQNVANATTPGYHRQAPSFVSRTIGDNQGGGVAISRFVRYSAPALRTGVLQSNSESGRLTARLDVQRQAETLFSTGTGAIDGRLEAFFNQLEQLSSRPEDASQRRVAVDDAGALSVRFNSLANDLARLRDTAARGTQTAVAAVNDLTPRIADLNTRISSVEVSGDQANDLRDQRDQLINQLSHYVDVRVTEQEFGVVNVIGANAPLVVGDLSTKLESGTDPSGALFVRIEGTTTPLKIASGQVAGLIEEHNRTLPDYQTRLDTLARQFIAAVNGVQSTGLTPSGPTTAALGTFSVANAAAPLATQNLPIPAQAGDLFVSVTNTATGARTLNRIAIDPATQSLQDVAAAITAGTSGQVQATVDPATQTLRFTAQSGFAFDFAGRLPTTPNALNLNGTTAPTVTGTYTGAANDTYSFQVVGSGTVGTTSGLTLEVRNSSNAVISSLNIGSGYQPGSPLLVANGISVRLSAGTTNAGSFNVPVTANADTANLLPALGVNGLFTGSDAATIAVRPEIVADPSRLAATRSGQPGDTSNLTRFAALRDAKGLANGTQNFRDFFGDTVGAVGSAVASLDQLQTVQANLGANLEAQEQSVVGVDLNEEMLHLLTYQRMVESASRYISVVNKALDSVMEIAR